MDGYCSDLHSCVSDENLQLLTEMDGYSSVSVDSEEYRQDMEDVLITRTLMDLTVVKELCDSLKSSVETQRALASQCLQNQLTLLSMQVLTKLHSASRALQTPVLLLQESISSGCSSVEDQLSGRAQVLHSSSSIASSLRLTADENLQLLTEMDGYSSVSGLVERDLQWSFKARQHADRQNQELLAVTGAISTEAQAVQQ
ncbi:hypothetical protein FQA47_008544 [Oryzias melastigma]|uniref:Uncharacterized protein n=1 Tax=Oryzias melastigma TaxID=30732 RepID=A0A834C2F5_ORYME|nr:hypothetical protein FQA47_008544 [Oryzias melastigma]